MNTRFSAVAVAVLIVGMAASPAQAQDSPGVKGIRQAQEAMHEWLGSGEYADGWKSHLMSDELSKQLKLGRKADRKVVKEIVAKYTAPTQGLSAPRFVGVRRALEAWLVELETPTSDELPQAARDAKDAFIPVTEQQVAQAKAATERALTNLENFIGRTSGWRDFLRLADLRSQLSAAKPDPQVLDEILQQFARDYRGLELSQFSAVRSALDSYLARVRVTQDPEAEATYKKQLDLLAQSVAAHLASHKPGDLAQAAAALRWLEDRRQAPRIIKVAREAFWKPNLLIEISPEVATYGFQEPINDVDSINEYRNNAQVTGAARTTGWTVARLVPHERVAVIYNEFRGVSASRTTAYASQATVYSRGTTTIHAIKQISLDRDGFTGFPSTAAAFTQSYTENIDSAYVSQASQRVEASREENNDRASRRAENRIRDRLDRDTRKQLVDANNDFYKQFVNPLTKYGAYPADLHFSTTKDALRVRGQQSMADRLGATDDPPAPLNGKAMTTRMHETWFNNTAWAMYGGRAVAEDEFRKDVSDMLGRTPKRLERKDQTPPWTITFAADAPLSAQIGEGTIIVSLRGTSFKSGKSRAQEISMNVTASYQVAKDDKGPKYLRQGELQVLPPDVVAKFDKDADGWLNADEEKGLKEGAKLTGGQASLRGQLQDDLADVFEAEIRPEPQTLSGRWESLGQLKPDEVVATPGWLTMGYIVEKTPPKQPAKTAGK